ncbi:MAG: hypothetical protein ACOX2M_02940 [Fastidiosipilaceae bacterium]|jgi:hypothetical protein
MSDVMMEQATFAAAWEEMLGVLETVCAKNELPYLYADLRGSSAGDEFGLALWRPDFERLLAVLTDEIDRFLYYVQIPWIEQDLPFPHARICLNGSRFEFLETEPLQMHQGLYVNIYAIDAVSSGKITRKVQYNKYQTAQSKILEFYGLSRSMDESGSAGSAVQLLNERNAAMQVRKAESRPGPRQVGVIYPTFPDDIDRRWLETGLVERLRTVHERVERDELIAGARDWLDHLEQHPPRGAVFQMPSDFKKTGK